MTIDEKRKAIAAHCDVVDDCNHCVLQKFVGTRNCYSPDDDPTLDADVETNYNILFGATPIPCAVDHPTHYNREGAMECIKEMVLIFGVEENMSFCKLNAWKYRYRAADKGGLEDLKKSDNYLRMYKKLKDGECL